MQVARDLEALANDLRVEFDLRENLRIGLEVHRRAGAARRAHLLQAAGRLSLLEGHLVLMTVALHRGDELARERVDDAGADAVKAAGRLVVAGFELAAGVEHGEDHLERALLRLRMHVHGNAAAVVFDGDRGAVLVQGDADVARVPVHRLVDRVVERFPDEMMQAGAADAADVHAGALSNGLEPFEDGDVFGCVIRCHCGKIIKVPRVPAVPKVPSVPSLFFAAGLPCRRGFLAFAARFGFGARRLLQRPR